MSVTPSTNAMVTVAEQKEFLGIASADTGMDDFLQRAINDWSDAVETRLNRIIKSATHTDEAHDGGKKAILLKNPPVTAISSLSIDESALGAEDYVYDGASGIVRMGDGKPFGGGPGGILVTYTGGYSAVPGDLRLAVKKLVALEYYLGPGRKALAKRSEGVQGGNVVYERGPGDQEKILDGIARRYGRR